MIFSRLSIAAVGITMLTAAIAVSGAETITGEKADSLLLFSYSKPDGRSGLRLAWSDNGNTWHSICDPKGNSKSGYNFVSSDFGPWGSHKTMFDPVLHKTSDGWLATWYVSSKRETLAAAYSPDLIKWQPQRYASKEDSCGLGFCGLDKGVTSEVMVNGKNYNGYVIKVPSSTVSSLMEYVASRGEKSRREAQLMKDDGARFAGLKPLKASISPVKGIAPLAISDKLIGIFFEDISYAADGGLYGELVQNRDFEYDFSENHKKGWGPGYAWSLKDLAGNSNNMIFSDLDPLHQNNRNYLKISGNHRDLQLENSGFDGISIQKGESYYFSMFVRNNAKVSGLKFDVSLVSPDGKTACKGRINIKGKGWQKSEIKIKSSVSARNCRLVINIPAKTDCDIDMISLFPVNTFKGRRNGLRKDLAESLAALHPKFVRFPGGCVAHGDGIDNIYDWKGSIGPLESRKPLRNIWNYHQTRGLGYHEYFLMCEDLGAAPLPVLAAGVPCQNSGRKHAGSHNEITELGQQCGIPMEDMDDYVQDILDLIEYANGGVETEWGAKRAEAGHPAPFGLKYLGIGNEDMITEVFEERFKYIHDVLKEKHPEITVIGTVGPFFEGSDYDEGWRFAKKENVPMVDEHYYVAPGWYINNRRFYDGYDRKGPKVYLGEYASHLSDRSNTMETALSVALYLTDVERNGDVVEMTSYAPLFAKDNHVNWRPDMIYFNNDTIRFTPDYYVQQMYGQNSGTEYIPSEIKLSDTSEEVSKRIGHSLVRDPETCDLIVKIANLLPVAVSIDENLSDLGIVNGNAEIEVLSGHPDDKCTKPVKDSVSISGGSLKFEAAPYSFNVIRIGNHNEL